ncbi:MAG: DUF962 domain-containing protein [Phycisphaerales bacterium]|nr:DUF962 domain-containing protein [Phycisphaerales bacterium]
MKRTRPYWLENWFERHQHPVSRGLHYVGIPLTIAALLVAVWLVATWRGDLWWVPVALLFAGYFLQWWGHVLEGNELGEVVLVKKWLGKPYVAVSPRYAQRGGEGGRGGD